MLKFKIAKLEDVAEEFRKFYSQGADGAFYLQVEGAVAKEKLDEFRDSNIQLLKDMEKFKDVDPEKYATLKAEHDKLQEGELIKAGKVEELVAQRVAAMKTAHEAAMADLSKRYDVGQRQLETLLIDNEVRAHAAKVGVTATAVDDVLLRAKSMFKVEDGKPVAKDSEGKIIYGKDGTNSIGISDWIGGLKEQAPHLFAPSQGSNSGNMRQGTGNQGNGQRMNPINKISAGLADGNSAAIQN